MVSAGRAPAPARPDLILHNGRIATMSRARPFVEAVAIGDGRFVAVGDERGSPRDARARRRRSSTSAGRTAIPGLNDSHLHVIRGGLNYNLELRWDGVPSLADAMRMLREQVARTPPGQWVRVVGGFARAAVRRAAAARRSRS